MLRAFFYYNKFTNDKKLINTAAGHSIPILKNPYVFCCFYGKKHYFCR